MLGDKLENKIEQIGSTLNKKMDVLSKKVVSLESGQKEIRCMIDRSTNIRAVPLVLPTSCTEVPSAADSIPPDSIPGDVTTDLNEGIISTYQISVETLRVYFGAASSLGNFAVKLVERLYPELFGPDHLRLMYSYKGNGKHAKKELDPVRKAIVKRYVCHFNPEMNSEGPYQKLVIDAINERLRRPVPQIRADARKRSKSVTSIQPVTFTHQDDSAHYQPSFDDDMYMDISASRDILDHSFLEL